MLAVVFSPCLSRKRQLYSGFPGCLSRNRLLRWHVPPACQGKGHIVDLWASLGSPSVSGPLRVSLVLSGPFFVSLGFPGLLWLSLGFSELLWTSPSLSEHLWTSLVLLGDISWSLWASRAFFGPLWASPGVSGLSKRLSDSVALSGPPWISLGLLEPF